MKKGEREKKREAIPVMPAEQLINLKSTRSCVTRPPSPLPSHSALDNNNKTDYKPPLHLLQ